MEYDYSEESKADMKWWESIALAVLLCLGFLVYYIIVPAKEKIGRFFGKFFGPNRIEI